MPSGVPGAKAIRLIEVSGLSSSRSGGATGRHWLVVSTVPERQWSDAAVESGLHDMEWVASRALAHQAVVERFLEADAVLPMQLFALFRTDERAVEHVVQRRRAVAKILSRIEHQVEWGVRVTLDQTAKAAAGDDGRGDRRSAANLSGSEYLNRKRAARDESRLRLQRARADATHVYRALSPSATRAQRRTDLERAAAGSRVVLDAAFLVPASRSRSFAAAVRRHTRPLAQSGMTVSFTGPWPAYNFI